MKKILFVTNRNILTTSGELRLIKNRAEFLYDEYGIPTDFIAFSSKDRIQNNKREDINAGGNIKTYELALLNLVITLKSYIKIKEEVETRLATNQYGAVVLSGIGMPTLTKNIKKKSHIPVYLDIHGALEDIIESSKKTSGISATIFRLMYHVDRRAIKNGLKYSDGVFVVTEALKDYLVENFEVDTNKKVFVVPCATSTTPIDVDEYRADRTVYRRKYNISNDEIVFVYSGGVSSWQCVKETIELYKKIANCLELKTRMLILSHNINEINDLAKGDERIQTDSYLPDELFHALRVGDFAFLLRRDNVTNNVAFPNKFLEYVQSGMHIITTPYVKEIAKQTIENNLGYIYDFDKDIDELLQYIKNVKGIINEDVINSVLVYNSFGNTTKVFAKGFIDDSSR